MGGGQLTPISGGLPAGLYSRGAESCVPLSLYAKHLGIDECGVWGVRYAGQINAACGSIWQMNQRNTLMDYLAQAQSTIEDFIGYPVCARWIANEEHPFKLYVKARYKYVIEAGVRATSAIAAGAVVEYANDPAMIGPIATTAVIANEVHVYFPGTQDEIIPDLVTIAGGEVTIYIPRCRMVKPELWANDPQGLDYTSEDNFTETVDVTRVYNDTSTQATVIWPAGKLGNTCTPVTDSACEKITSYEQGRIMVGPGSCGANWGACIAPTTVLLNYKAGAPALTIKAIDAIIRLAHSMMPEGPCGCDLAQQAWERDRYVPDFVATERMQNPFGINDGAWFAYLYAKQLELRHISVM